MKDEQKLKKELIDELKSLRKKVKNLETISTSKASIHKQQNNTDLTENIPDHITRFDTSGRLQYVSPSFTRDYGVTPDDIIDKTLLELSIPCAADGNKKYYKAVLQVSKGGKPKILVGKWITSHGERTFEVRYIPEKNKDGKVVSVLGIARDITKRKRIEEKLHDSEERLRLTLETTRIGIWDWDVKNDKWYASPVYYTMLGYEPKTGPADRNEWLKRLHPDDRAYVYEKIQDVISRDFNEYQYEARLKHADGSYRWQYVRGFSIKRDEEGTVIRMLGIRIDINERKMAEEAIQASEEKYRALIQKIQVAVVVHGPDTSILTCNSLAENLLGLTEDQLLGKTGTDPDWHFLKKDNTVMQIEEYPVNQVLTTNHSIRNLVIGVHRPGKNDDVWVLVNADPVFYNEKIVQVIVTFINITDRIHAEEALRESEGRYQKAQTIGHIGSWEYNLQTALFWGSDEAKRIYGFDVNVDTFDANEVENCIPERERVHQALIDLIERDQEYNLEFDIITNDTKTRKTIISKADLERDKTGRPIKITGVIHDITSRKQAEKALIESEKRYHTVFENSPVSIWEEDFSEVKKIFDELRMEGVKDIEAYIVQHPETIQLCADLTKIVDVNRAALAMHAASNKQELIACLGNTFTPESFDTFRRELVGLWNGETQMVSDGVVKTLAGDSRNVTVYFSVCPGHEETFSEILVSLIDITERKRNDAINVSRFHLMQFAEAHSLNELLEETLNEAEKLTDSLIGFYHFVDDDQKSLTLQDWSTKTKAEFCKAEGKGLHYNIDEAGVWVDCIKLKKPVIHNDYASLSHRKGIPEGHAEVNRELVVPVFRGNKIKAILGVGNKPSDYNEKDIEAISLLADLAWEITERKLVDNALQRINRELRAISNCNQTLLRAFDEQSLLNEICRIICDEAGYMLAWVGFVEHDEAKTVRPMAWAGYDYEYIEDAKFSWSENTEHGKGPAGKAIRIGETIYVQDFSTDPQMEPWRESTLRYGYRSGLALPLKDEHYKTFGVLMIYSGEPNIITPDEIRLMEELSGDLAFGITALRIRAERKRTEMELQRSNDMLRAIIEAAPTAIFDLDLDGNVKAIWNSAAEKMLGWSAQEVIGRPLPSVTADKKMEFKQFREQIRSGKILDGIEVHRQRRDGTPIDYCIYASPLYDAEGSVTGNVSVLMDITERKRAEKVIFESERRFKNLANLLPQTIFESDINGIITFANETALTTFGYSADEIAHGVKIINMVSEKDRKEAFNNIQSILENLLPDKNEYEMIRKDGTTFPALAFSAPIIREGKAIGIRGTIADITVRKQTENELRKLSEAVSQSPASIVITNLNGNIEYVNKTFEETTGYELNEIINQNPRILKSGNMPSDVYEKLWTSLVSGTTWRGEFLNKKKDGTLYWEDATISPIKDKDNRIINYLAVKQDITEKKRITEELIKAKEKAEKSDKLKTEFLAQMSHEIRTPMNVTLNMLSLIKEELEDKLTSQISEYLTSIESAGKRLVRTVELILNTAEMQIGSYEPVWVLISLRQDMIDPLILEYRGQAKAKGLELIFTEKITGSKIYADEFSTNQIFSNLVDNAIKYTPKGEVEIIIEKDLKDNICVTVADTGIGISEEFMQKLFEPFMQEERGYSRSYEGNGLGLALVKKYCDLNNATINVESEKGKGSRFIVTFLQR